MTSAQPAAPYQNLVAWKRSMDLAAHVFRILPLIPRGARGALSGQMSRAAVSIPANIAEGYGRRSNPEFVHFLRVSIGSLRELETLLLLAERAGARVPAEQMRLTWEAADETGRCLTGLLARATRQKDDAERMPQV